MAVFFGIAMVACSNADSLIDDLEKAANKGDAVKMEKIFEKLKKKELTKEQELRVLQISSKYSVDMINSMSTEIKNTNSKLNDYDDDYDEDMDW